MKLHLPYPWRFLLAMLGCAAILAARTPDLFFAHSLAFEDGTVFFADAYNLTPLDAILKVYAGYWHLIPRFIAEIGMLLPFRRVPHFYSACALLLSSIAISWFYLPHFRSVVGHDGLRLVFVLLLVLMPGLSTPLWIAYSQWLVALWGMLLVLMTPPRKLWVQWVLAAAYVAALATAPALFVLLPLWFYRFVKAANRSQRLWIAVILVATLAIAAATLQIQIHAPTEPEDWSLLGTDVVRSVAFRLFAEPFLGYQLARKIIRTMGWPAVYALALVMAAVLVVAAIVGTKGSTDDPKGGSKGHLYLALAYIMVSTVALYLRRAHYYGYIFAVPAVPPLYSGRYHFLAVCAVYLAALVALDRLAAKRLITYSSIWIAVLIMVLLYSPNFTMVHWWYDRSWPHIAHLLDNVIDSSSRAEVTWSTAYPPPAAVEVGTGAPETVALSMRTVPASSGWTMVLYLLAGSPQGYLFPEGPRLLSVDSHVAGDRLKVELDWQTPGPQGYTAYVHLLDRQGSRVGGADVKLDPPPEPHQPDEVWTTEHVIDLPPGMEKGSYDVAVGLYTLENGQLLPGSDVILPKRVTLGMPGQ